MDFVLLFLRSKSHLRLSRPPMRYLKNFQTKSGTSSLPLKLSSTFKYSGSLIDLVYAMSCQSLKTMSRI